jgi:putative ATP-dependent endonuclease of the OLD family
MKLDRLMIKNYRSIEELTLSFPTYYSALSGKNDSGKSNVLRTIRNFFPHLGPRYFIRQEAISFKEDIPKWFGKDTKDRPIEIEMELTADAERDSGLHAFLTSYLKMQEVKGPLNIVIRSIYTVDAPDGTTRVQVAGQDVGTLEAQNVIQKLQSSAIVLFHNSTDSQSPYYVEEQWQYLSQLSSADSEKLDAARDKLNNTVTRIARKHQEEVGELLGRLKERYTVGLSFPKIDPREMPLSVTLGDARMNVALENWGSGTQNRTEILLTLFKARKVSEAEISASKITPILVIEEPEAFLHPSAQAEFGNLLQEISAEFRVQVIVTTHSPYMLSQQEPASNLLLERHIERTKVRDTRRVDTSGDKWMEPFGTALGIDNEQFIPWKEALFGKHDRLLLVEGETDKEYFELLRDPRHGAKGLKFTGEILAYGGKDTIKQRFLLSFIKSRYKKCFVTFDLDAREEVEQCLKDTGFQCEAHYLPVGLDEPGKRAIEGLIPEAIRAAVYAANPGVVEQAVNSTGKDKNSARNKLKKLILENFKKTATPGDDYYKAFMRLLGTSTRLCPENERNPGTVLPHPIP